MPCCVVDHVVKKVFEVEVAETVWCAIESLYEMCLLFQVAIEKNLLIEPGIVIALNFMGELLLEDCVALEKVAYYWDYGFKYVAEVFGPILQCVDVGVLCEVQVCVYDVYPVVYYFSYRVSFNPGYFD